MDLDEVGAAYDVGEAGDAHFGEILPYVLSQEGEVVDQVFAPSQEALAQFGVLCRYTHRTGVLVAFTHHHAAEHDEGCRTETVFLSSKESHEHDVAASLQLSVNLHSYVTSQSVLYERLLCLRQTDLGRDTGKAHA